jgi:hypothetical protein
MYFYLFERMRKGRQKGGKGKEKVRIKVKGERLKVITE